jgi:hypothetical protein
MYCMVSPARIPKTTGIGTIEEGVRLRPTPGIAKAPRNNTCTAGVTVPSIIISGASATLANRVPFSA